MEKSQFTAKDDITGLILSKGIKTWEELKTHICLLPYGRNMDRSDLSLVIKEEKGTCSSKHALLKHVADLNNIPNIELILCLYKMNESNTPGIGDPLQISNLKFIPEAHCYLLDNGLKLDLTNKDSDIRRIEEDIIEELPIEPQEVNQFKVNYHKDYLMQWIVKDRIPFSFEQVWSIREQCIANLSQVV